MQALLQQPFPPFAKAGGDDSPQEGIMVAFMLPAAVAEELATWAAEAGIAPEEAVPTEMLHLTLVYVGNVSDIPAEKQAEVRGRLLRVVQEVADLHLPLTGKVNGHGLFVNEDERAYWAAFDSPHLPALRQDLVDKLNGTGVPISLRHGFTPHITLAYLPAGREMPQSIPPAADLTFETLAVAWGEEVFEIQPRAVNTSKSQRWDDKSSHAWQIIMSNLHTPTTKALTMPELAQRAIMAIEKTLAGTAKEYEWSLDGLYTTFAIVTLDGTFYRVDFTVDGNTVSVPKRRDWVEVTREWVADLTPSVVFASAEEMASTAEAPMTTLNTSPTGGTFVTRAASGNYSVVFADDRTVGLPTAETLVIEGGEIKSVTLNTLEGDMATIGGYLVRFTSPDELDSYGHYFTKDTDFGPLRQSVAFYDHAQDPTIKARPLGTGVGTLTIDDEGVWFETQLNLREKYERQMFRLAQKGKLGLSSGTAPHLVKFSPAPVGKGVHIDQWTLGIDASLTVRPAAGPNLTQVMPLKSYTSPQSFAKAAAEFLEEEEEEAATNPVDSHTEAQGTQARPQDGAQAHVEAPPSASAAEPQGVVSGNPNGGAVDASQTNTDLEDEEMFTLDELKAVVADANKELRDEVATIKKALETEAAINDPGHRVPSKKSALGSPTVLHYTDPAVALKQMQNELSDGDFYAVNHRHTAAFAKALLSPQRLTGEERALLDRQVFAPTHVKMLMEMGVESRAIKEMQMMAQGSLGGYAMPSLMQENIVTYLANNSFFRESGANVILLTGESNVYTVPKYKVDSDEYPSTLRGSFTGEAGDANTSNYKLESDDLKAEVYSFKIPKTVQEIRAPGLVQNLQRMIGRTRAADENRVFVTGHGAGMPLGILPNGANGNNFRAVASGHASLLTTDGVVLLKQSVPQNYRERGVFIANSTTMGKIQLLTESGTGSGFAFRSYGETGMISRRPGRESGWMPDIAANAFPLAYADLSCYYIVDFPGMSIQFMQDTATGLNKGEVHVMAQFGGRPVEPWGFSVQKIATTV